MLSKVLFFCNRTIKANFRGEYLFDFFSATYRYKGTFVGRTFAVSDHCKPSFSKGLKDEGGFGVKVIKALEKIILHIQSFIRQTRSSISLRVNSRLDGNQHENY
ncbi:MAG: hypothetical protein ACI8Z9_002324 [Paraglaciecola sp.]|jgi:hypothetical protein